MAKNKINKKILDFIDDIDHDDEIKLFLKDCLDMEYDRDERGARNYFKDYDKIVNRYIK